MLTTSKITINYKKSIISLCFLVCVINNTVAATIKQAGSTITIKIGIVAPFSGNYANYGEQLLSAVNQTISEQSIDSNIVLQAISYDDLGDPAQAILIAKKIVKDPMIKAVITHTCAANNLTANKIYARSGIIQLIPAVANAAITQQGHNNIFRMCGDHKTQMQSIANLLFQRFLDKKIAILHTADLYNQNVAATLQEELAILKISPSLYQSIELTCFYDYNKLKKLINKISKLNIDVIFLAGCYQETALLIKTLVYQGIKIPVITSDLIATPVFLKILKDPYIATGVIMSLPKMPSDPTRGVDLQILGTAALQTFYQALLAIVHQVELKPDNINNMLINYLHQHKITTILGEQSWNTNGDLIDPEFNLYHWLKDGSYNLIN